MSRRVKPIWGYEHTHDVNDMGQREARLDYGHIEKLVGEPIAGPEVSLDQDIIALLVSFYCQTFDPPSPTREQQNAALSEITELLIALQHRVEAIDNMTLGVIETSLLRTYRKRRLEGRDPTLRALARSAPRKKEALEAISFSLSRLMPPSFQLPLNQKGDDRT